MIALFLVKMADLVMITEEDMIVEAWEGAIGTMVGTWVAHQVIAVFQNL